MPRTIEPSKITQPRSSSRTPIPLRKILNLRNNDRIVFNALQHVPSATHQELVKLYALPASTIYAALMRLVRHGLVERHHEVRTTRGRPKIFYFLTV